MDSYKKVGALEDEKDRCYLQRHIFSQKSKLQTIHCSKQMRDLLTAVYISKGKHQTMGKLDSLAYSFGYKGWLWRKRDQI